MRRARRLGGPLPVQALLELPSGRGRRGVWIFGVVFDRQAHALAETDPDSTAAGLVAAHRSRRQQRDPCDLDRRSMPAQREPELAFDRVTHLGRDIEVLGADPKLHEVSLVVERNVGSVASIHK